MNEYEVIITPEAEANIISAFQYIDDRAPANAERWLRELYSRIASLQIFPRRCALAREHEYYEGELRQLIYKSHRVVFLIEEEQKIVRVLHVVHGRQRTIGETSQSQE